MGEMIKKIKEQEEKALEVSTTRDFLDRSFSLDYYSL